MLAVIAIMFPALCVGQTSQAVQQPSSSAVHVTLSSLPFVDTLVLCPPRFSAALQPWITYRESQGHQIHVVAPASNAFEIKRQIRHFATTGHLKYIWLIGDTPSFGKANDSTISTDYLPAQAIRKYGSDPEIASDQPFADLDDDHVPDLVIGRLPVNTPNELSEQISKIIRYEQQSLGESRLPWKRKINFVAGTGGFGLVVDQMIEKVSKRVISDLIPPEFKTSMTYASWTSPYCPDPRKFSDEAIARLNEGCLFWVYVGHGQPHQLDFVRTPVGGYPILHPQQLPEVQSMTGCPIAILLACYTGAFDLVDDCVAEQLMKRPAGPVAVLCGTRVTTPYGMSLMSIHLMEQYFERRVETLGELMLAAKRSLILEDAESRLSAEDSSTGELDQRTLLCQQIELLNRALGQPGVDQDRERLEHAYLFHLLGDPLLRLPHPQKLELDVPLEAKPAERVVITGVAPHAGELRLQLSYARDRLVHRTQRRQEFNRDPAALTQYQAVYEAANDRECVSTSTPLEAGPFAIELEIPEWARGRCVVQGMLEGSAEFSLGAQPIQIKRR